MSLILSKEVNMVVEVKVGDHVFTIKPDPTTRNKYYSVMVNPFKDYYDSKVLYGGSYEIVERKIIKQYEKFKGEIINE